MIHRPVLVLLTLASMLIAGSRVGRRVTAQEPGVQAPTAMEVTQDLARPGVLEQIRADLWGDWRSSSAALQSLPSAQAMTLTPAGRPIFELRRDFWTGRARLVPSTYKGEPQNGFVVLISHGDRALATAHVDPVDSSSGSHYRISTVTEDPALAQHMLDMGPDEKLVQQWDKPFFEGPWRADGGRLRSTDSFPDSSHTTTIQAATGTSILNGDPTFVFPMIPIISLAFLFLFPWTCAERNADRSDQEH